MTTALLLLAAFHLAAPAEAPDTVVVCPPAFVEALRPWIVHRTQQGRRIGFLSAEHSLDDTRAALRASARSGRLQFVLLVGDPAPVDADPATRARSLPAPQVAAKVNVRFGSESHIAADNWLADLDDDGVPELAIGRLTADSPAELGVMVEKILAYERSTDHGEWRQRLNFVAGVGGFGPLVDTVVESATKKFLTECVPASYSTTMTYGSWRSPFCPDPRRFHATTLQRLNEGCLFWVYLGHGRPTALDDVRLPGAAVHILGAADAPKLAARRHPPIAVFLACYTAAYDQPRDCLAEEMLRAPGGPVAVLGGSRVTMPYGQAVLGTAMLDECFARRRATLGEAILHAKRRAAGDEAGDLNRQMLDALASALSPSTTQLAAERLEHLQLFNLLGDPLLRLRHPDPIAVEAPEEIEADSVMEIVGDCPIPGRCRIELVCRRDRFKQSFPTRDQFQPTHEALAAYTEVYEQANDGRWCQEFVTLAAPGRFRATLTIPGEANGPCHVRLFVEGREQHAAGTANVFVRRAAVAPVAPAAANASLAPVVRVVQPVK